MNKTIRMQILISEETRAVIKRTAESTGLSMTQVIEDSVHKYAENDNWLQNVIMDLHAVATDNCIKLEAVRDIEPNKFTGQMEAYLDKMNEIGDWCRQQPDFWELQLDD